MSNGLQSTQDSSIDAERTKLEHAKLQAEIDSIRRPFYKTTAFYTAILPVVLAILGLIFSWWSGWFDVQRTRITNEKTLIEAQTVQLKTERTTLEAQAREQQSIYASAEAEIKKLKEREADLTNQVTRLERDRDELRSAKNLLESETKRLAGSDVKASQFLEQLISLQKEREQMATNVAALKASNITLQANLERETALIQWANQVLSEG
jgi:chromosome segregation ATPase